jgi:hypothetical protein
MIYMQNEYIIHIVQKILFHPLEPASTVRNPGSLFPSVYQKFDKIEHMCYNRFIRETLPPPYLTIRTLAVIEF